MGKDRDRGFSACAAAADQQMEAAGLCRSHFNYLQKLFALLSSAEMG